MNLVVPVTYYGAEGKVGHFDEAMNLPVTHLRVVGYSSVCVSGMADDANEERCMLVRFVFRCVIEHVRFRVGVRDIIRSVDEAGFV